MIQTNAPLTPTQQLIVAAASARRDRMVMPLPAEVKARGAARNRILVTLIDRGVVKEVPTKNAAIAWRQSEEGKHMTLRLVAKAAEARAASAVSPTTLPPQGANPPKQPAAPSAPVTSANCTGGAVRPGGKLGGVLLAVGAANGATLDELVALTGWLPHTTRAALTRLKQRGYPIQLARHTDRKAYQLAQPTAG